MAFTAQESANYGLQSPLVIKMFNVFSNRCHSFSTKPLQNTVYAFSNKNFFVSSFSPQT